MMAFAPVSADPVDPAQLRVPTFELPTVIETMASAGVVAPALVDLDGDRDLDLVVGLADGSLVYFQNDGDILSSAFNETALSTIDGISVSGRAAPVFGDLDKDGDLDLILGSTDGSVTFYLNNGTVLNPDFVEQSSTENPFDGFGVAANSYPAMGDIDSNGTLDVLVGAADGSVKYLSNTGTVIAPVFTELTGDTSFLSDLNFGANAAPSLGDIDGDTDVDLMVGSADGTFTFYLNGRGGYQGDSITLHDEPIEGSVFYEPGVVLVDTGWSQLSPAVEIIPQELLGTLMVMVMLTLSQVMPQEVFS